MDVLFAILPIILLFVLMLGFKMPGHKSAFITLVVTVLIALFLPKQLGFAPEAYTQGGVWWAVVEGLLKATFPILIIILMAIYSYNILLKSGEIEVLKRQFTSLSDDKGVTVLLLTWGFGGLLEGMAGFGTAVAIPAAILMSLGFKPGFSALVSLIANSVPTGFGAVGVPVTTLANEVAATGVATHEDLLDISSKVVLQLSPLMIILPFIILFLTDRSSKALVKNIILALVVGIVSLVVQFASARYLGAETPAIFGSVAAILVIILYAKLFTKSGNRESDKKASLKENLRAWSVYFFILLFIVLSGPLVPPINAFLKSHLVSQVHLPIYVEGKFFTFGWLSNAGLMLFLGSVIGGLIQGLSFKTLMQILGKTVVGLRKTIITILSLVSIASVMSYAGMIVVIAATLAAATGSLYPLFAPLIGAIGTFVTGSDTSSNILFGKLQSNVSTQIAYPDHNWLVAANTAGATGGKIISPQSIAIATAACNMEGEDGKILASALPYAIGYIILAGLMVYFSVGII
ncbi:MAG: L-lactate permease [Bacteroidales bacterium]|uniref:L-lactate permease n=1 Tax=Porphyromonas sp. TaxID=1924944 RepID=UPI002979999B|nr:L-lactate permease [Porphyromonas sp.]MDD7437293.1 L-lactate permease [Bacteroidales bacterium]MDY3066570.1 L-lactate permease [Porphyromonas sp.]